MKYHSPFCYSWSEFSISLPKWSNKARSVTKYKRKKLDHTNFFHCPSFLKKQFFLTWVQFKNIHLQKVSWKPRVSFNRIYNSYLLDITPNDTIMMKIYGLHEPWQFFLCILHNGNVFFVLLNHVENCYNEYIFNVVYVLSVLLICIICL